MFKRYFDLFVKFVKENKFLFAIFLISTCFFIFQHHKQLTWDFSSYVLNARYLFYGGNYFEILRPPLVPFILGIFLFLGKFSEYIFIFISSLLFFISCVIFSDEVFKWNRLKKENVRFIFYFFSLSSYVLFYGLMAGTELISVSFLGLFIVFVLKKKVSGHFLGLGMLARYNFFIFFPLLFFNKNYKIILKNLGFAFLIFCPWLLFNYFKYGNFIASVIDSLTLNVLNRGYLYEPFTLTPLILVVGWFLPFFLIGIFVCIKKIFENRGGRYTNVILFLATFLILYDFITNPQKKLRFLFNFVLPVAYFSSAGFFLILNKFKKIRKHTVVVLFIIFLVIVAGFFSAFYKIDYNSLFSNAADDVRSLGLEDCEIVSPDWVPVAYYTENVYPFYDGSIVEAVEQNKTVLIFKKLDSIDFTKRDLFLLDDLKFYETEDYVFYSNGPEVCSEKYIYEEPYTDYVFCPNLARKFEGIGLKEKFEKLCFVFNKN